MQHFKQQFMRLRNLVHPVKQWYTEREVCAWKGVSYATFSRAENRWLLPSGGETKVVGPGRQRMYHIDDVLPWLAKTQDDIKAECPFRRSGVTAEGSVPA